jgi:hypothetical protein
MEQLVVKNECELISIPNDDDHMIVADWTDRKIYIVRIQRVSANGHHR